jgi:cytochrome b561
MENQPQRFGPVAIALHWGIAALVLGGVILGWFQVTMDTSRTRDVVMLTHKSVGLTILILTCLRLVWRLTHRAPPLPAEMTAFQRLAAWTTHASLRGRDTSFFGLFLVPQLSPLDRTLARLTKDAHSYGQYVLYALIIAHVGAALYHRLILRDGVLARMWPLRNAPTQ